MMFSFAVSLLLAVIGAVLWIEGGPHPRTWGAWLQWSPARAGPGRAGGLGGERAAEVNEDRAHGDRILHGLTRIVQAAQSLPHLPRSSSSTPSIGWERRPGRAQGGGPCESIDESP